MYRFSHLLCTLILLLGSGYTGAAETFSLYFVRHAEKQLSAGKEPGSTDPELTEPGQLRAQHLAQILKDAKISAIYSTNYQRTQQTAAPLANWLKQSIVSYDPTTLASFIKQVLNKKQNALIVGHSNTTPDVVKFAGGKAVPIDESHYGNLFQLIFKVEGDNTQLIAQIDLNVPPQPL